MSKKNFAKKTLPMAMAAVMALSPMQVMAASNDLTGHWAEKVITEWQGKGLIKGYEDGTFKPNNKVTRAEFVIMMNNALGLSGTTAISFTDVKAGDWFYNAVATAAANGYTKGYEDNTFKPGATITRAEAAVMIAKAASLEANAAAADVFTDAAAIPAWAKGSVGAAIAAGFMSGYPDGSFGATKSITRAEAVSSLNRVMGGAAAEEVTKDVVVTEDDTVIENGVIAGDLIIDEKVGEGEVYLNDVVVEGNIIVNGGGDDSIYMKNVTVKGKIHVNKKGVRLHLSGDTKIPKMEVTEISQITSEDFEGEVGTITITGALSTGEKVIINVPADAVVVEGKANISIESNVATVEITDAAEGTKVDIAKDATVDTIIADAKATIGGTGTVENLEANASGITVNKDLGVNSTDTAAGVDKPVVSGGSSGGGGGSSSGGGSTVVTKEEVAASVAAITVKAGESAKAAIKLTGASFNETAAPTQISIEKPAEIGAYVDDAFAVVVDPAATTTADEYTLKLSIPKEMLSISDTAKYQISGDTVTANVKVTVTEADAPVGPETPEKETFKVTIADTENGTVTTTKTAFASGDEVVLTITPMDGYELDQLLVDGIDVTAKVAAGKYTFTMPANAVEVSAAFKATVVTPPEDPEEPEKTPTIKAVTAAARKDVDGLAALPNDGKYKVEQEDYEITVTADSTALAAPTEAELEDNGSLDKDGKYVGIALTLELEHVALEDVLYSVDDKDYAALGESEVVAENTFIFYMNVAEDKTATRYIKASAEAEAIELNFTFEDTAEEISEEVTE